MPSSFSGLFNALHRFLFYLELRRDILQGQLVCQTSMAYKLASFALQGACACVCMCMDVCVCVSVCTHCLA